MCHLCQNCLITTRPFPIYSDSVAVENTEAKGEVTVASDAKLLEEVVKGVSETGPQQTEEEKEKQEEEASVVQENEGKEDTSDTQKEDTIFRSSTVEIKLIPVKETEESMEEVQEPLDEYVSFLNSVFPAISLVWKANGQKAFGHQNQLLIRQMNED